MVKSAGLRAGGPPSRRSGDSQAASERGPSRQAALDRAEHAKGRLQVGALPDFEAAAVQGRMGGVPPQCASVWWRAKMHAMVSNASLSGPATSPPRPPSSRTAARRSRVAACVTPPAQA